MTDHDRKLIVQLRSVDHMSVEDCFLQSPLFVKAADRIEELAHQLQRATDCHQDTVEYAKLLEARISELETALSILKHQSEWTNNDALQGQQK